MKIGKRKLIKELIDIKKRERKLQEQEKQRMENEENYKKQKEKDKENFEFFYNSLKDQIQFNNIKIETDLAFMEMNHYFNECKIIEIPVYLGTFLTLDYEFYYIFKIVDPVDNKPIRLLYIKDKYDGSEFINMCDWKEEEQKAWEKVKEKYGSYECYDEETGEQWQLMGDDETGTKFIFRHRRLNGKREYFEVDKSISNREEDQRRAFELLKKLNYDRYMKTPCYLDKKDNKYWFKYVPNNDGNWECFSINIEEKTEQEKTEDLTYCTLDELFQNLIGKSDLKSLRTVINLIDYYCKVTKTSYPNFFDRKYGMIFEDNDQDLIANEVSHRILQSLQDCKYLNIYDIYEVWENQLNHEFIEKCLKCLNDKKLIDFDGTNIQYIIPLNERKIELIKKIQELKDEEHIKRLEEVLDTEDGNIPF